MKYVTNREAGALARSRKPFVTGNKTMTGGWKLGHVNGELRGWYVVYSYGSHFPIYVYDEVLGQWIGNRDKYGQTTSNHQRITRPDVVDHWVDTDTLRSIAAWGYVGAITHRMEEYA